MDTITSPRLCSLSLILAPADQGTAALLALTARLAAVYPVMVIDGGNRFDAYAIARRIRATQVEVSTALRRIEIARAFTCQQLLVILEAAPADGRPKILFSPLEAFLDNDLFAAERATIFERCLEHIRRISRAAPIFISAGRQAAGGAEGRARWQALQDAADQVLFSTDPTPPPLPAKLF